jgi:hypothetical protein
MIQSKLSRKGYADAVKKTALYRLSGSPANIYNLMDGDVTDESDGEEVSSQQKRCVLHASVLSSLTSLSCFCVADLR